MNVEFRRQLGVSDESPLWWMAGQWSFRDSFMIYALLNCYCISIQFRYNLVDNNNAQLRSTHQNDCKCNTYANKSFIKPEQLLIARNVTFLSIVLFNIRLLFVILCTRSTEWISKNAYYMHAFAPLSGFQCAHTSLWQKFSCNTCTFNVIMLHYYAFIIMNCGSCVVV